MEVKQKIEASKKYTKIFKLKIKSLTEKMRLKKFLKTIHRSSIQHPYNQRQISITG